MCPAALFGCGERWAYREDLYRQLILGRLPVNEGLIFENAVMQALVCNGYTPFFVHVIMQINIGMILRLTFWFPTRAKQNLKYILLK